MDLSIRKKEQEIIVTIEGEITAQECETFSNQLIKIADEKPPIVVLDMGKVPFVDSSGLGVLVGLKTHMKKNNVELVLKNLQDDVWKVFEMTRLSKIFPLSE